VEGDIEYSFRHALILEVAYATLPRATRRERHAAVAGYVEHATELRAESLAWVLAYHWNRAGEPARAVPYLLAAAERARDGWAREGVVELYSRALELAEDDGERTRIRLLRGFALVELQDYLRAAEELGELLPQLAGTDEVEALLARGRATLWTEQDEETLAMAERALELARGLGSDELVAAALALLAQGHGMRGAEGDIDRALELGNDALAAWVPGTRQADLAEHLHLHSDVHYWTGRYEQAIDLGRRSKEAGGVSHSAEMLMRGAGIAGLSMTAAGRHEEALEMFDASMAQARELDRYVGTLLNYSSMAYREIYDLAEARRRSEEALALNPGWAGFGMPTMMARVDLLFTAMLEGDPGAAQADWPSLWEDTAQTAGWQSWLLVGKLAAARAELELATGTPEAAAEWAQKAIEVAVRTHRRKYEARSRSALGEALAALGRTDEGERELRAAVELADGLGSPPGRWLARRSLGTALAATASDEGAGAAFDEAAAIVREFASTLTPERAERFLDAEPIRDLLRAAV
jgi:tetratricopeptide (TPR) repeat protein